MTYPVGTQNILGMTMPTVYVDGVDYLLPTTDRGNRKETFEKESKEWMDLDRILHERIKGYRLSAKYEWDFLLNTEINDLLNIYNAAKTTNNLKIKFSSFPRRYTFRIVGFTHQIAAGLGFKSSAKLEIEGINLLNAFPNPDQFITMPPLLGRGIIVRSLAAVRFPEE